MPKILNLMRIIQYCSKLFTGVLKTQETAAERCNILKLEMEDLQRQLQRKREEHEEAEAELSAARIKVAVAKRRPMRPGPQDPSNR